MKFRYRVEKNGTRQERRRGEAPAAKLYFNEEAYHLEALIAVGIGPLLPRSSVPISVVDNW